MVARGVRRRQRLAPALPLWPHRASHEGGHAMDLGHCGIGCEEP
jgi:hypothetical protein